VNDSGFADLVRSGYNGLTREQKSEMSEAPSLFKIRKIYGILNPYMFDEDAISDFLRESL
jgi:hypothetical protein